MTLHFEREILKAKWLIERIRQIRLYSLNLLYKLIICGIFSYYFLANLTLSSSWDIVNLRSIDDLAVQQSIRRIQVAAISGDWKTVFSFVDYAYGSIFWILNGFLQFPFYLIGNEQLQIIAGRQISLVFVFSGIYLIGQIIDHVNSEFQFAGIKYETLTVVSSMPIIGIIGTKAHVNAQSFFFSMLSLLIIVRKQKLTNKNQVVSAVVGGLAIGLKATSILIVPLTCLLVFSKLREQKTLAIRSLCNYLVITITVALVSTAPIIVLFPIYEKEIISVIRAFTFFSNMGEGNWSVRFRLVGGMGYFLSPIALAISMIGFATLILFELKIRSYFFSAVFFGSIFSLIVVLAMVHKSPGYIGNYMISIGFLFPLGILAINKLRVSEKQRKAIAVLIVLLMTMSGLDYRNAIMQRHSFFKISNSDTIQEKLTARTEINDLISPIGLPARVLMDAEAVFPLSNFTKGAEIRHLYGDLSKYEPNSWGTFDFISLNIRGWYNEPLVDSSTPTPEQAIRDELIKNNVI